MTPDPKTYVVTLSARAVRDLTELRDYIAAQGAPLNAERFASKVADAIQSLEAHPFRGRMAGGGIRELATVPPYLIRYRVRLAVVEVIRIKHAAQRR